MPLSSSNNGNLSRKERKLDARRTTEHLKLCENLTNEDKQQLDRVLKALRGSRKIVIIAGAGISVSAGISDFRSPTGLFKSLHKGKRLFDVSVYQDDSATSSFHELVRELAQQTIKAQPTAFHHLLASIAQDGRLMRLYTQNIDGIDSSLLPLKTEVPFPAKGPWPITVQLHGSLRHMVCFKCRTVFDLDPALFDGPVPPDCPSCYSDNIAREAAGRRSHGVGRLRPRMVLYNEPNPDDEAIGACVEADLRTEPDAVIVVGTTLTVPGVQRIVREMCTIARGRRNGITIWINNDPVPKIKKLENLWDLVVQTPCDEVAQLAALRRWDDPMRNKVVTDGKLPEHRSPISTHARPKELLDGLISETKSLLRQLEDAKYAVENSVNQFETSSIPDSHTASSASRPPEDVHTLRNVLSSIIDNANILLGHIPPGDGAAEWADVQQITNPSTSASTNAPDQSRPNAERVTEPPSENALSIPPLSDPAPSPRNQSLGHPQNNTFEEQHRNRLNREPDGTPGAGAGSASQSSDKGRVDAVYFVTEQMGLALVPQLEKMAAVTPQCYDKIRITGFAPPDFSHAQVPAPGYMTGSIYTKDGLQVTALATEADFTFPSADTLSQEHSRPCLEEIRSSFQAVFDNPPSEALPYFVGPIPMPPEYVPLVDAGPRLRRRNNGNIPGVNTPFWYISQCSQTPATLHIEDGNLGSVNLLLAGAPKLWLFVPECEKTSIERRMKELYGPGRIPCSQKIRHYNAIISPALLDEWGITYYLDCCLPGEMIVTRQNTYHQVLNLGPNIAESVNIEFSDTPAMPLGYLWCKKGHGPAACGAHVIAASDFGISRVERRSNTKRTRTTPAPKSKKAKTPSVLSNFKSIAYGRFTNTQVHNTFAAQLGSQADGSTIELLTCLFFAVASPRAISELRQTCCLRRSSSSSYLFLAGETVGEATKALEKIEDVLSSCSIVRRYYLLSLAYRRDSLIQQHRLQPAQRTRNSGTEKIQKAESLALQDLYYEAYNRRDPSTKLQTRIKNWLRYGRNWASLVQKFSIGVLALVPAGGNTALTNSQIERIKEDDFCVFLNVLEQERGRFVRQMAAAVDHIYADILFNPEPTQRYHFEQVDQDVFCDISFDDERLLEYCAKKTQFTC